MGEEAKSGGLPKWVLWVVAAMALPVMCCFGMGVVGAASGDRRGAPSSSSPRAATPQAPPLDVDAKKLWSAYQDNEVSADEAYKGRTLRVSGHLNAISKDFTDEIFLQLNAPNEFMPTRAYLEESQRGAAGALKKGQQIVVTCTGGGMMVGSPILKNCVIAR